MSIVKLIKRNKYFFSFVLLLSEFYYSFFKSFFKRDDILFKLNNDGICIIDNYYSEKLCQKLLSKIDKIDAKLYTKYDNDHRIFGAENLIMEINNFHCDQKILKISKRYLKSVPINQATLLGILNFSKDSKFGSGGGWHIDSYSKQFK